MRRAIIVTAVLGVAFRGRRDDDPAGAQTRPASLSVVDRLELAHCFDAACA